MPYLDVPVRWNAVYRLNLSALNRHGNFRQTGLTFVDYNQAISGGGLKL